MAVMKEWACLEHGEFEGTHPICPFQPCDSKFVKQEFRTPPAIRTRMMKQFDAGMKRSAEMMKLNNFRTAKAGEAAYGGDAQAKYGSQVLWGDESRKVLGRTFGELTGLAQRPLTVQRKDGSTDTLTRNCGMAEAAELAGVTKRRVAKPGEVVVPRGTDLAPTGKFSSESVAKAITT